MEESGDPSIYAPLCATRQEIRILILAPAQDFNAEICCDLSHVSLDDKPVYEALSYTWGDPQITKTVLLKGSSFQVTTNLATALRHLRHKDEPRVLWADAICINQANITEREQQVAIMSRIYTLASSDVLWLGLGGSLEDCAGAKEILQ